MAWSNSTGFKQALLSRLTTGDNITLASDVTFTTDKIQTSSTDLSSFVVGSFACVFGGSNENITAKVLVSTANELTFAANTFTAEASGSPRALFSPKGGSYSEIMRNGVIHLYTGTPPASPDDAETGTLLAIISLNGNTFSAGVPTNGINTGQYASGILHKALDPNTGGTEVWSGDGVADGTAGWGRWYDNAATTGASTTAVRRDGTVTTVGGGDIVMSSGRDIVTGVPAVVTSIAIQM